jgi:hypothetical protein
VRRLLAALAAVAAVAAVAAAAWWVGGARAQDAAPAATPAAHPLTAAVDAGTYHRLDTDHGPVHVWVPAGYHPEDAALIFYVHGYYTDVDTAWTKHRLPEQFASSGLNAVFVACEAPKGSRQDVFWSSLGDLVQTVLGETSLPRPLGPLVAVGHSGAYRTLVEWLDYPMLDTIILVDALYNELDAFRTWVLASPDRRIIDLSQDTIRWSEELSSSLAEAGLSTVTVDRVPRDDLDWPDGIRDARAVMIRSQLEHMALVTDGVAIPVVLRLLPVEILPESPWKHPLGQLP